jgi:hypothetical protein
MSGSLIGDATRTNGQTQEYEQSHEEGKKKNHTNVGKQETKQTRGRRSIVFFLCVFFLFCFFILCFFLGVRGPIAFELRAGRATAVPHTNSPADHQGH